MVAFTFENLPATDHTTLRCSQAPGFGKAFRNIWENSVGRLDHPTAATLLRSKLDGWFKIAVMSRGSTRLDEDDLGLLSEMRLLIDDGLREKWDADRIIRALQVAAGEKGVTL